MNPLDLSSDELAGFLDDLPAPFAERHAGVVAKLRAMQQAKRTKEHEDARFNAGQASIVPAIMRLAEAFSHLQELPTSSAKHLFAEVIAIEEEMYINRGALIGMRLSDQGRFLEEKSRAVAARIEQALSRFEATSGAPLTVVDDNQTRARVLLAQLIYKERVVEHQTWDGKIPPDGFWYGYCQNAMHRLANQAQHGLLSASLLEHPALDPEIRRTFWDSDRSGFGGLFSPLRSLVDGEPLDEDTLAVMEDRLVHGPKPEPERTRDTIHQMSRTFA